MKTIPGHLGLLALAGALHGGPRGSEDYSVATDTVDGGGSRATSTSYTHDGSAGGVGGISTVASPAGTAKHGYLGQLYEVTAVTLSATPATIDEGGTRQLGAAAILDDLTTLALPGSEVDWSVVLGPLTGIDAGGVATAGLVPANTPAAAQGTYQGIDGQLGLTVLDTIADNYHEYGGDGVADDWQVAHFGEPPNPDAGPAENPDHDPHDNLFESLTGFDPNDGGDFLRFFLLDRAGITATLRLSKVIPGTVYTVRRSSDLAATVPFSTFPSSSFTVGSEGADFDLTDHNTPGAAQFYLLEVQAE